MPDYKYIKSDEFDKLSWRDKRNIKKIQSLVFKPNFESDDLFTAFIRSFVLGKSVYGDSPLRRRYFWKLPTRTDDYAKNYENIVTWLKEYTMMVPNNKGLISNLNTDLSLTELEHFKHSCSSNRTPEESVRFLTDIRRQRNRTKYDLYQDYLNAIVIHKKRKKPWFFQRTARAQYNAEEAAIKDFEKYMVSMGVDQKCLKNAKKNYTLDDVMTFNNSLKTNAYDRVEQFKQAYKNMELLYDAAKKNHVSKQDKAFALTQASVNFYLGCRIMHTKEANKVRNSYEQQAYEEEQRLIDNYKKTMLEKYNVNEEYLDSSIENHMEERFSENSHFAKHCTVVPAKYSTYSDNTVEEINTFNSLLENLRNARSRHTNDKELDDSLDDSMFSDEEVYESDDEIQNQVESINLNNNMNDRMNVSISNLDEEESSYDSREEDELDIEEYNKEKEDLVL